MNGAKRAVLLAALLAAVAAQAIAAQQEGAPTRSLRVKVPVKQYKALEPAGVYRAAIDNIQADVRFGDAFERRTVVPQAVSRVTIRGVQYLVALAFRTRGDLVCLVPYSSPEALRVLLGLPADWPLTAGVLNRPLSLNEGQQITIEGTIAGTTVGEKHVLVDAVLVGPEGRAPTQRELLVFRPGVQQPEIISAPGTSTLTFPCAYQEGQTEEVKISVQAMGARDLMSEVARIAAGREGRPQGVKTYGLYEPGIVYRHARDGKTLTVDFTDEVSHIFGPSVPAPLATAPALRGGFPVQVGVGYAFQTVGEVTCLVPADLPTLLIRAGSVLPGEQVRIRGTITGRQESFTSVLVDYIGFPAQEGSGRGDVWVVRLEWPPWPARVFWDYGIYVVPDLPCRHVAGRFEALQLVLREFRLVEVQQPVAPAEAAEEAEEQEG
ncbi:MAG: hypothetical protein ACYS8K_03840 [Planctomycetota bacterium]|jgi:hypothetical protein